MSAFRKRTDRQIDTPWVFDEKATYKVDGQVTDCVEVFGVERVAQRCDIGQRRQLVSTKKRRTTAQTVTHRYTT